MNRIDAALMFAMAGLVVGGGCAVEEDEVTTDVIYAKPVPGGDGCPTYGCGSNSPEIEFDAFHELNERGLPNLEGYSIVDFKKNWQGGDRSYRPDVRNGELVARNHATGAVVHSGAALAGATFTIRHKAGAEYDLAVMSIGVIKMWGKNNGPAYTTPTYQFGWRPKGSGAHYTALCTYGRATAAGNETFAVLFEDDRIDSDALRFTGTHSDWFNIGCAGHALAKAHLTGHTKAGSAILEQQTTRAERTTFLKMITGDYCGGGDPFTVAGEPLMWKDAKGIYDSVKQPAVVEARWSEHGAVCVNKPRVDHNHTAAGNDFFPDGVSELLDPGAGWCAVRPPACTGAATDVSFNGSYMVSALKI